MADQNMRITNLPDSGSRERVALELAARINAAEHGSGKGPSANPRRYWLELYAQCLTATSNQMAAPDVT